MSPKETKKRQGIVIPKGSGQVKPKEVRWSLPADLAAALDLAAERNQVDPVEVARFILTKGLRVELAEIRKGSVG